MADVLRVLWLLEAPDHSGVSFAARHMAVGMQRAGDRMAIFALRDGEVADDFAQTGCPVEIFPRMGKLLFGGAALAAARDLRVAVVHALTPALARCAERMARNLGIPAVVTANRMEAGELRLLSKFRGQGVVAVSEAIRERLANTAGIQARRSRVFPNGLDLAAMPKPDFTSRTAAVPGRLPVVGTFGQLAERKGQRVFLQAVRTLLDRGLDAEFVVLGDGPDRTALRGLAQELRVDKRITFTPQTVSGQLTQLDVLVEPSLREGLGLSVMQAMAMGVPVVGTGVGGLYSLIEDGKTGLMVPANNPAALAEAIWRVLHDGEARIDMARQARELIEREFSADLVAARLSAYYREILAEFPGWDGGDSGARR